MDIKEAFYKQKNELHACQREVRKLQKRFSRKLSFFVENYAVPVFPLILFTGMTQLYLSIQPVPVFVSMGMTASLFTLHIWRKILLESLLLIDNSSIINSMREIHVLHEDLNIDNPNV